MTTSESIPHRDALTVLREGQTFAAAVHPGVILAEEFIEAHGVSVYAVAKAAGVPQTRLAEILAGRRSITADTAVRLAIVFGTTAEFWLHLQQQYELAALLAERGAALLQEASPLPAEAVASASGV
jgi:addiction module HigA family antidote